MGLDPPGGLDRITLVDLPDPGAPGPGQVRVGVLASSVNFHDYLVAGGFTPLDGPRIPLADGAGVVEAVGDGVSELAVGDLVVSCFFPTWLDGVPPVEDFSTVPGDGVDGFARETVVLPASAFTRAPVGYSPVEAATITTAGLTAWRALVVEAQLKAGDTVLVLGTGGVSTWALKLAVAMGAHVIATSSSDAKLEQMRAMGATHTTNYRSEPDWGAKARAITGGAGVDHVLDIGGPGTLDQSLTAVRVGGHVSLIGVLTGESGHVSTGLMLLRQPRLHPILVGSRSHQQDLVRYLDGTSVRPVLDRSHAFEDLAQAFGYELGGGHLGKIPVTWGA